MILRGRRLPVTPIELVLIVWFTVMSVRRVIGPAIVGPVDLGWDAVVYARAARALLDGGNPWEAGIPNAVYAAPPPSLIPFLPFAYLPEPVVQAAWVGLNVLAAVYVLRALKLPPWWLLFPPMVLSIAAGSDALPLVALLVWGRNVADRRGIAAEAFAVIGRVYSAVPLLFLAKWRPLVLAGVAVVLTAPFLAWDLYLRDLPRILGLLLQQSGGGSSTLAVPLLIPLAVVGLVLLGRRKAAWLAVPALWPNAQEYYAVIALPVAASVPIATLAMATPLAPGLIAVGLFLQGAFDRWQQRRARTAPGASAPDHRATADGASSAHP